MLLSIFREVAVKVLAGAAVISSPEWAMVCFQAHSLVGWQVSEDLLLSSLMWLLASLSSSLCGPLPSAASQYGSCLSLERASKRERENRQWKPLCFYSLISEVTSHHMNHILFTKNESISPAHKPAFKG